MVLGLPAVPALDAGGAVGGGLGGAERGRRVGARWPARSTADVGQHHRAGAPACGGGAEKGGGGSARQGVGRSRGGLTTKIHLRVNAWGLPMRADVTLGQTSDHRGFDLVMGDDVPAPAALLGDKGDGRRSHPGLRRGPRCGARDPDAPLLQSSDGHRPRPLSPAQSDRTLHRPAQAQPPRRHTLRQDRHQPPRLRRSHLHPLMGSGFFQHGLAVQSRHLVGGIETEALWL